MPHDPAQSVHDDGRGCPDQVDDEQRGQAVPVTCTFDEEQKRAEHGQDRHDQEDVHEEELVRTGEVEVRDAEQCPCHGPQDSDDHGHDEPPGDFRYRTKNNSICKDLCQRCLYQ